MARPKKQELTDRELEVIQVFWQRGESTVAEVRDALAGHGRDLAYTTVATLVRILFDKRFLKQTHHERPFRFVAARTFEEVSGNLLRDLTQKVFRGSRERLLVQLLDQRELSQRERAVLENLLKESGE